MTEGDETRRVPANGVVIAAVAAIAVLALTMVAVVALVSGDNSGTMMGNANQMPGSMMNGPMMSGSMMNGTNGMMGGGSSSATIPGAREVAITASSFRFDPSEIHVQAGEAVTIVLTTTDIVHDFTIDELGLKVVASPGQVGRGSFRAPSTPGRYTAYCSVAGHRQAGMTAVVVVGG